MKTPLKRFDVWIADLNPPNGTEPGKIRPVVVVQTDLLNNYHPSTLVCPLTTNVIPGAEILRVNLAKNEGGLKKRSAVLVDQVRAIDNKRLLKKSGSLSKASKLKLMNNLKTILDLD
mgnify:FL=1